MLLHLIFLHWHILSIIRIVDKFASVVNEIIKFEFKLSFVFYRHLALLNHIRLLGGSPHVNDLLAYFHAIQELHSVLHTFFINEFTKGKSTIRPIRDVLNQMEAFQTSIPQKQVLNLVICKFLR